MKKILLFAVGLLLFAASSAFAQSGDRDHPTPLNSGEIKGSLNNNNEETFYSFVAGPGELTITVDVKAKSGEIGVLNFELLAKNAATSLLCCEFAQADDGGAGRDAKSVKITRRQTVILHTTNGPVGGGTFNIRITGATAFASSETSDKDNDSNNSRRDRGNQISVPANGTLRIRMKDGSTKEIDLSLVREISVKP